MPEIPPAKGPSPIEYAEKPMFFDITTEKPTIINKTTAITFIIANQNSDSPNPFTPNTFNENKIIKRVRHHIQVGTFGNQNLIIVEAAFNSAGSDTAQANQSKIYC